MRIPVTIFAVLLAFQASAQENKITVSGRAWGSVENVGTTGAPGATPNVRQRFRVTNDSSYVRVRGDMKLSDDLSAWGQVETQFALDGVGLPFDSGRNTGVGFTSKTLGTITAGRWDSPYKLAVIKLDPWGNTTINNYAAIMGSGPSGGNLYDARLGNGVQYWTPVISGFQARVATMVNEDKTADINPSVLSVSATYDGPIYVGVAYETRKDCSNANGQGFNLGATALPVGTNINCTGSVLATHGRDWGVRAGVGINFKPTHSEVGVIYEHLESQGDFAAAPTSRKAKRDAYYASLVQGLGGDAHQLVGAIGQAGNSSGNAFAGSTADATGALYWTAALRHNFNKDLFVYAAYVQIRNEFRAQYRFGSSGFTGAQQNVTGSNYYGWSIGTRYLF
jgi:predicted porin